jgi:peptidoglycan/xylan/chitin deacetylase (PgdA/CDA1 family)
VRRRPSAIATVVVAALILATGTACGNEAHAKQAAPAAAAQTPEATGSAVPTGPADPTPSTSPTARASASASAARSVSPSASAPRKPAGARTTKPAPPPPAPDAPWVPRPPGTGEGPAGSMPRTGSDAVALTFDDGPDPVNTPQILDLLAQNGVKATFCLVGSRARDFPDVVRRIAAEGHTLCNHSWQHLLALGSQDAGYIHWDLEQTNQAIRNAVPGAQIKYFRAPGGNFTPDLVRIARGYGMQPLYWDADPKDWDHTIDASHQAHIDRVVAAVKSQVRQGSVVLSHDNKQPDTIAAYRVLLPWLKARLTLIAMPV